MKITFISDTHNQHKNLVIDPCDLLIHCGDWSYKGEEGEVKRFCRWLDLLPADQIVVIPGNHEKVFAKNLPNSMQWFNSIKAKLLIHESIEVNGLKIFGSPWTPYFFDWAWNAGRDITEAAHVQKPFIGDLWKDIPDDTDILITHGPPAGILDTVIDRNTGRILNVGCKELLKKIESLSKLKVHAFGHIHLDGGKIYTKDGVKFINAAICDERYNTNNKIITIDI